MVPMPCTLQSAAVTALVTLCPQFVCDHGEPMLHPEGHEAKLSFGLRADGQGLGAWPRLEAARGRQV